MVNHALATWIPCIVEIENSACLNLFFSGAKPQEAGPGWSGSLSSFPSFDRAPENWRPSKALHPAASSALYEGDPSFWVLTEWPGGFVSWTPTSVLRPLERVGGCSSSPSSNCLWNPQLGHLDNRGPSYFGGVMAEAPHPHTFWRCRGPAKCWMGAGSTYSPPTGR